MPHGKYFRVGLMQQHENQETNRRSIVGGIHDGMRCRLLLMITANEKTP